MRKNRRRKNKKFKVTLSMPRLTNDSYTEQQLIKATHFFGKELMSTRMLNTISIKLKVRKTTLKDFSGAVVSYCKGSQKQTEYAILLDYNLPTHALIEILAHEMQHVQQMVTGRLQYRVWKSDRQLHARWEGKEVGTVNSIPYRQRPWEVEAYSTQTPLFKKYEKHTLKTRGFF